MGSRVDILVLQEVLCGMVYFFTPFIDITDIMGQFILQAICDHCGIFIGWELGWPGSVSDATVFQESDMWFNRAEYLTKISTFW